MPLTPRSTVTLVPLSVANTALAMTRVSWSDYLIGSALGMLPMTVAQVQIGASGGLVLHGQGNWLLACPRTCLDGNLAGRTTAAHGCGAQVVEVFHSEDQVRCNGPSPGCGPIGK